MTLQQLKNQIGQRQIAIDRDLAQEVRRYKELQQDMRKKAQELKSMQMNFVKSQGMIKKLSAQRQMLRRASTRVNAKLNSETLRKSVIEKKWRNAISKSLANIQISGVKRKRRASKK